MKNEKVIIPIIFFGIIILFLISKKRKDKEIEKNQENKTDINFKSDIIVYKEKEKDEDVEISDKSDKAVRGSVSPKSVYILIKKALDDYDNYCKIKGWTNNFSNNDEVVRNILTHFWIETGNFQYVYDNSLGNLTAGSWKTKDPYVCSPYIKDIYAHRYMGIVWRGDRGEKDGKQEFRRYEKLIDSIVDYIDLINRAKRYNGIAKLYNLKDPVFIKELGYAGYYSADPNMIYNIAKNIKNSLSNVI